LVKNKFSFSHKRVSYTILSDLREEDPKKDCLCTAIPHRKCQRKAIYRVEALDSKMKPMAVIWACDKCAIELDIKQWLNSKLVVPSYICKI